MRPRAWLRSNRWALLALVVLAPAAVATALSLRFLPYLQSQPEVVPVAIGETVRYSGADITIDELFRADGDELGAPVGRDVVVAAWTIEVREPSDAAYCESEAVATIDGLERRWKSEGYPAIDFDFDDRYEFLCSFTEAGRYELVQTYFVPEDTLDAAIVELSSTAESPRVLRFTE